MTLQEKLIKDTFTSQKFEVLIPANQTPIGSPVITTSQITSTSSTTNLPELDIPVLELEPETKSSSSDKEEDIKQIIAEEEPKIDKPMSNLPRLEFEAEYCFTHKGITYRGYLDPTQEEAYQKEIDFCILLQLSPKFHRLP